MKRKIVSILVCLWVFISFLGCGTTIRNKNIPKDSTPIVQESKTTSKEGNLTQGSTSKGNNYVDITISSVGDILIHSGIYKSAYDEKNKSYNFNEQFKYVKPLLEKADITVANLETTLSGQEAGYSGYPTFNSPDSIVDALKECGVDILTASNNHRLDKGEKGYYRTIDTVRSKGLDIIGVKKSEEEKSYVIKNIKGVKVGLINIGYESKLKDGTRTLNGIPIPKKLNNLIDSVDYSDITEAYTKVEKLVLETKAQGAELLIVFMHWGNEYERKPDDGQKKIARKLCELGVDVIFGGHPHVLQPAEYISEGNNETFVFYSQGNFISSQRIETINNVYSEQGIIGNATLRYYKNGKKEIVEASYIPTWVNLKNSPKLIYEVIPADEALRDRGVFKNINAKDIERISYCKDSVDKLMNSMDTKAVFKGTK